LTDFSFSAYYKGILLFDMITAVHLLSISNPRRYSSS